MSTQPKNVEVEARDRALATARKIGGAVSFGITNAGIRNDDPNLQSAEYLGLVNDIAEMIQSAMNAEMKQKELGVIEHFKNAVSDGCVCGVCEAVRDAMNAQEREPLDLLRRFIKRFEIKPSSDVCTVCKCRFEHSNDCLVAEAKRLLAERGEGR